MAVGIQFYRENNSPGFKNSVETEKFTLQMNNMFDALNRKYPAEGIKIHSNDLEVSYVLHAIFVCVTNLCLLINLLLSESTQFNLNSYS